MFELAGYETLDLIGGGGFGEVWLACQTSTGRNVAVKVAHAPISDETLQIRFEREYKALGRLSGHPNIVDIITAGKLADGRAYLVLEFVEGGTLWDKAQTKRISEDQLLRVGLELAKALDTAHTAGVLHRDIKPENILLRESGEAVVSDFGLAHLQDGATTSPNAVVASVAYAAPEILRGEAATTATDIYGLGVCLLTAATQSVPFVELTDKSIQTVIKRVLTVDPTSITAIGYSELFGSLVSELLAKDANQRPNNAAELVRRFAELPDLKNEQDFSWSDLLGPAEKRILPTGEMPAISVHDHNELVDNDPIEGNPSDNNLVSEDLSNNTATSTSDEHLDDVDQLIFELTNTGDTAEAQAEFAADEATTNVDGQPKATTRDPAEDGSLDGDPTNGNPPGTALTETDPTGADEADTPAVENDEDQPPAPSEATREAPNDATRDAPNDATRDNATNEATRDNATSDAPNEATMEMTAISVEALAPMTKPSPKPPADREPTSQEVLSHIDQGAPYEAESDPALAQQAPTKSERKNPSATPDTFSERPHPTSEPPTSWVTSAGQSWAKSVPSSKTPEPDSDTRPDTDSALDRVLIPAQDNGPATSTENEPDPVDDWTPETGQLVERELAEGWAKRILLGIAIIVGLVIAIGALRSMFGSDSSSDDSPRSGSGESSVVLPLTIDSVDLPAGTIEATTPSQGPIAPLFCDQNPNADGLLGWKGSQLFTPENEASIEQLVVDFDQPESARSYATSIVETTQCDSWTLARETSVFTATTKQAEPDKTVGDQTFLFETTIQNASGDKTATKTWLIVSDVDVFVFSITASDENQLLELEPLATQAGEKFMDPN